MNFIIEVDKLKEILRQTYTTKKTRQENSSEHSWHIALMAIILSEYTNDPKINLFKVVKMLLIHDIVEIDAGDTFAYDKQGQKTQQEREAKAAKRIFNLLPTDQAKNLQTLWSEFEECQTPNAQFANAIDRLQPLVNNYYTNGLAWQKNNVKVNQIKPRNKAIKQATPKLWQYAKTLIEKAITQGILQE
jgi:putative hydrolase of HD superfamily